MVRKAVIVGLLLVVGLTGLGLGREIVVTSTADSGTGSFRWALQTVRSGDTITFDPAVFPPNDPATIYPRSELPPIDRGDQGSRLTIDASNAGVILDGVNVPGDWNNGLQIYADDCVVMGLQIMNFTGSGITAAGASRTRIGGDRRVGGGPTGQGNLLANNGIGINLGGGGTDTVIEGNIIGTDVSLTEPLGNTVFGISIEDGVVGTVIGPDNVFAYNRIGIDIQGAGAIRNTITRNVFLRSHSAVISLGRGGNGELAAPFVLLINPSEGQVSGTACAGCSVEVYTFSDDGLSVFEGRAVADTSGRFSLQKGEPLVGATAIALASDIDGNSSPLSRQFGTSARLQEMVSSIPRQLVTLPSGELTDNRISVFTCALLHPEYEPEVFSEYGVLDPQHMLDLGVKRVRLSINNLDVDKIDWDVSEFVVEPRHDAFITELVENGVAVTFNLTFWDKGFASQGGTVSYPRFQSEKEIQRYLEYVEFVVSHFKGQIEYYELWNEPTNRDSIMWIEVDDYIDLARRAIPIIRREDPAARIIVSDTYPVFPDHRAYLFALLESELMPLVDVVAWHPMYGTSPAYAFHAEYYYGYSALVRDIKQTAAAHGFDGEYEGDELNWLTPDQSNPYQPWPNEYTESQCAKYFARGIVMHLGLVDSVSMILLNNKPMVYWTIQNLCTTMAGNVSTGMPVNIDIEYDGPVAYCAFRYPNGDRMLAVWTDGIAQDEDPGVPATITFPGLTAETVTGIDVLHGFEQELAFEIDGDDTIIRDLLVKNYPILIRLSDVTTGPDYEETVGDGFHRLGDVDAVPSSTGGGSDRDGDGVPDDEDYCPDWPGSKEANGC